ncbi:Nucleic acid-binding, OB-fold [Artemisia annua]|nr:Nucleic acid-binding, OB-fold [Artemisia annua]
MKVHQQNTRGLVRVIASALTVTQPFAMRSGLPVRRKTFLQRWSWMLSLPENRNGTPPITAGEAIKKMGNARVSGMRNQLTKKAQRSWSVSGCANCHKQVATATNFITKSARRDVLPFKTLNKPRFVVQSAGVDVDVNVAVEQTEQSDSPDSPVSSQDSPQTSEPTSTVDKTKQRSRPVRKSEMPPVKDEELVPGASFTGKVRSIQPFGAFIDFGAFTDGLVHVSRLSDGYVKDVANVVSVGQEVKVKLVEANLETGRIALTMRDESASGGDSSRPPRKTGQGSGPRRNEGRKTTKFVKGQDLEGTVKNLTRSGAFINLPEGEEGFLPQSEEADEGFGSLMGDGSSLEVGQEVKVRVLKIARGQVTLTMKKDEDAKAFDSKLQGKVFTATNPFLVAFRQNKDIASFLDEREKVEESTVDEKVEVEEEISGESETQAAVEETEVASPEPEEVEKVEPVSDEEVKPEETSSITGSSEQIDTPVVEENVVEVTSEEQVEIPEETSSIASSSEQVDIPATEDEDTKVEPVSDENGSITSEEQVDVPEEPSSVTNSIEQVVEENVVEETQVEEAVENKVEETEPKEVDAVTPVEDPKVEVDAVTPVEDPKVEVEAVTPVAETAPTKATISPALVKQLREETGAGMMDCKKALAETEGDLVKAQEYLRKKGLASADKKASRATAEGRIGSYIHDSRIGVLVEVNCETDFVSRGDIFKELVNDLAMQVAACPQVQVLSPEDVPQETIEKEKAIEMQKEDLMSKPEQFRSKIVEGRIKKRLDELALLEQAYIKNDKVVVKDYIKSTIATIGENIKVKRFVRFNLGEGLEKKTQDFAAEVAAQTTAKKASAPAAEPQPAATEPVTVDE